MGIDSLVVIEIRNWWRQTLGLDISVMEFMNAGNIDGLTQVALAGSKSSSSQIRQNDVAECLLSILS
jgi:aryl carrier-like protein